MTMNSMSYQAGLRNGGESAAMRYLWSEFLHSRGLQKPDGRPLYRYRCVDDEFQRLQDILRGSRSRDPMREPCLSAVFCMFGAEWWRRNYDGGTWKWDPILEAANRMDVNPRELTDVGLEYWDRDVMSRGHGSRMFLGTLIVEGGLPMRVLHADRNGSLVRYMMRVLADLDRFSATEESAGQMAARHCSRLPLSLRNDGIYELVGRLLCGVIRYRDKLPDPPEGDPVCWLDVNHPGWREDFPLVVDDGAARQLLAGLMREAVVLRRRGGSVTALVTRILTSASDGWRPGIETGRAGRLDEAVLPAAALADLKDVIRVRFHAAGALESTTPRPLATIRHVGGDDPGWEVESLPGGPMRLLCPTDAVVEFSLRIDGRDRLRFTPAGGDALPTGPWVFEAAAEEDGCAIPDTLRFIAGGSVRSRANRLFVACPGGLLPTAESGAATVTDLGPVAGTGRRVAAITGTVVIRDCQGGPSVVVRAGDVLDEEARLLVVGTPAKWQVEGRVAVIGTPEFRECDADGTVTRVERRELRWRPTGMGLPWKMMSVGDPPCGSIDVGIVRKNELVDQTRIAILPRRMTVEGVPFDQSGGELAISGLEGVELAVDAGRLPRDVRVSVLCEETGIRKVTVVSDGTPPSSIAVDLLFPNGGPLRCRLPVPARGGGFLDANGYWMPNSKRVALDQLYGLRVRPGASGGTLFAGAGGGSNLGRQLWVRRLIDEECSLTPLRASFLQLLAAAPTVAAALDAIIRVSIDSGGRSVELRMSWFDLEFELDRSLRTISLKQQQWNGMQPSERENVQVLCRPIDDPASDERMLTPEPRTSGERPVWKLDDTNLPPGGWLIYGKVADRYRVRPIHKVIPGEMPPPADAEGLVACTRVAEHITRQTALKKVLDRMSERPDHPDWDILDGALDVIQGRLPLLTLDVFPILAGHPAALLAFLARARADRVASILKMDSELSFLWVLLPVDAWLAAFSRLRNMRLEQTQKEGLPPPVVAILTAQVDSEIRDALHTICEIKPSLRQTAMLVREHLGLTEADDCTKIRLANPRFRQVMRQVIEEARMELRRRAADQRWPDWYDFRTRFSNLPAENDCGLQQFLPVMDSPFAAAEIAVGGLRSDPETAQALRLCREFNTEWFDVAYPIAVGLAITRARMSLS